MSGIKYFLFPKSGSWGKLFSLKIWLNATTQCFFSLTIGMGCIIMFSGYNKFDRNIYKWVKNETNYTDSTYKMFQGRNRCEFDGHIYKSSQWLHNLRDSWKFVTENRSRYQRSGARFSETRFHNLSRCSVKNWNKSSWRWCLASSKILKDFHWRVLIEFVSDHGDFIFRDAFYNWFRLCCGTAQ